MTPTQYFAIMFFICFATIIASVVYNRHKVKKSTKQDLTSERMAEVEERVANFLAEHSISPGSDISSILDVLKIERGGTRFGIHGQAHLSEPNEKGVMTVTLRWGLTPQEENFALAHECGHILNGDGTPINRLTGSHKDPSEQEADYIAAALLMPRRDVYNYLITQGFSDATPQTRVKIARELCEKYDVDEVTAARRIQEVFMLAKLENA